MTLAKKLQIEKERLLGGLEDSALERRVGRAGRFPLPSANTYPGTRTNAHKHTRTKSSFAYANSANSNYGQLQIAA